MLINILHGTENTITLSALSFKFSSNLFGVPRFREILQEIHIGSIQSTTVTQNWENPIE